MIYALANRGADILTEELGIDRKKINWTTKNIEAKERYIFHTIMVSQIRTIVTLAARENPYLELSFFEREGKYKDYTFLQENNKKVKIAIVPDGFFCVKYRNKEYCFFLEADRSTMTNKRCLRKMRGYWNYWKKQKYLKKLAIGNFRVLIVTKTDARRDNLCKVAKKADDKQTGSQLFWFVSQHQLSLKAPEDFFFANIWKTPKEDQRSLLAPN